MVCVSMTEMFVYPSKIVCAFYNFKAHFPSFDNLVTWRLFKSVSFYNFTPGFITWL